jgi:Uma2 family endonuclease
MAMQVARRRFTIHDYHRMGEVGILHEDERIELIDGEIVMLEAISPKHAGCVNALSHHAVMALSDRFIVSVQNPVQLSMLHEPQPDLAILRKGISYDERLPTAEDVLLSIEVADTTLNYDRRVKLPLYARAGIPEVWLVDLQGQRLARYSPPVNGAYQLVLRARRGQTLTSTTIPGFALPFKIVFGRT